MRSTWLEWYLLPVEAGSCTWGGRSNLAVFFFFFLFAFILFVFSDECIYITLCCLWLVDEDDWFGLTQNHNKGETIDLCGGCPFFFYLFFLFSKFFIFPGRIGPCYMAGISFSPLSFFFPNEKRLTKRGRFLSPQGNRKKRRRIPPAPFFFLFIFKIK